MAGTDETQSAPGTDDPADGKGSDGNGVGADGAPEAAKLAGDTTIDGEMKLEVIILAVSAARKIAGEIASRVKARMGEAPMIVLVGDETLAARLAEWRALAMRISVLHEAMESLVQTEDRQEGVGLPFLDEASEALKAVAKLLSFFKADTEYLGRTFDLDNTTLYPAVVGKLIAEGVSEVFLATSPILRREGDGGKDLVGGVERLLRLKTQLQQRLLENPGGPPIDDNADLDDAAATDAPVLIDPMRVDSEKAAAPGQQAEESAQAGTAGKVIENAAEKAAAKDAEDQQLRDEPLPGNRYAASVSCAPAVAPELTRTQRQVKSLIEATDALIDGLTAGTGSNVKLTDLQAASELAILIDRTTNACMLSPKFIKTGGHYRKWRHLFTTLFTGDQISYSGGAVVSFVLTDLKNARVIDGDVLHHATGNVRFPWFTRNIAASNLSVGRRKSQRITAPRSTA
ncbi:hypothetical protein [Mesorhizobium sp. LjNodule214]|uniref:hypothetical protein n=1 Tax=Mesorhizobium sp. LjNodule214 TaxID=3342252 RepID=UPI003ECC3681